MRAIKHPLATVLFMGERLEPLRRAAHEELKANRTVLLAGRHLAAVHAPDAFGGLYRWNDDVVHSYEYTEEEQLVRDVFTLPSGMPGPRTLSCKRDAFLGTALASLYDTNQAAATVPAPYPYLPDGAPVHGFLLRNWCSPGPLQSTQQQRSGRIAKCSLAALMLAAFTRLFLLLAACLSVLRGLACRFFAPEVISPPPRVLAALCALSSDRLSPEEAAAVWICLHAYEWQRREGAPHTELSQASYFEPLEVVICPMLDLMADTNKDTTRYTRFADGLAKVCATIGCAVALELDGPSPRTFLIGRPDTFTLYLSKHSQYISCHPALVLVTLIAGYTPPPKDDLAAPGSFLPLFPTAVPVSGVAVSQPETRLLVNAFLWLRYTN